MTSRWWFYPVIAGFALIITPLLLLMFAAMLVYPTLPSLEALTDYKPKIPLRVYSTEGVLIGEFGEERRALVKIDEVPNLMKKAVLAAEDDRFCALRITISPRAVSSKAPARSPCKWHAIFS
jgi:penicillin-binding protein 1A